MVRWDFLARLYKQKDSNDCAVTRTVYAGHQDRSSLELHEHRPGVEDVKRTARDRAVSDNRRPAIIR